MDRNVGRLDKRVRTVLGILLAVVSMAAVAWGSGLGSTTQIVVAGVALVVAAVLLATAGAESCPAYSLLGWTTRR